MAREFINGGRIKGNGILCVGIFSNTVGVTEKIALLETSPSQNANAHFGM